MADYPSLTLTGKPISQSYLNLVEYTGSHLVKATGDILKDFNTFATTASVLSTASWANSASWVANLYPQTEQVSASWASQSLSASWAPYIDTTGTTLYTASTYPITSSWAENSISSSWAPQPTIPDTVASASWASQSLSSSYATQARSASLAAELNVPNSAIIDSSNIQVSQSINFGAYNGAKIYAHKDTGFLDPFGGDAFIVTPGTSKRIYFGETSNCINITSPSTLSMPSDGTIINIGTYAASGLAILGLQGLITDANYTTSIDVGNRSLNGRWSITSGSLSASLSGTASWAETASYTVSASWAPQPTVSDSVASASWSSASLSASNADTSSLALSANNVYVGVDTASDAEQPIWFSISSSIYPGNNVPTKGTLTFNPSTQILTGTSSRAISASWAPQPTIPDTVVSASWASASINSSASLVASSLTPLSQSLLPAVSNSYDLGSVEFPWKHIYVGPNSLYIGGIPMTVSGSDVYVSGSKLTTNTTLIDGSTRIYLTSSTTQANSAPLKFSSGPLMLQSEAGAMEFYYDDFYASITTVSTPSSYTSVYPQAQNGTYVKATTVNAGDVQPYFATDPAKSLTGGYNNNQWQDDGTINNRFHIDLGTASIVQRIYLENGHHNGTNTQKGLKNFTFWGSNNAVAFNTLTFATDTDWTQLTTDITQFREHVASDISDPQYAIVTNGNAYRYYCLKTIDTWGVGQMTIRRIELQTGNYIGGDRKTIVLTDGARLITGSVPFTTTNGRLTSSAALSYDGTTLYTTASRAVTASFAPTVTVGLTATQSWTDWGSMTTQSMYINNGLIVSWSVSL